MKLHGASSSFITEGTLPLVFTSKNPAITQRQFFDLLAQHKEQVKRAIEQYGGVLFRGFPLADEHDFAAAIGELEMGAFADYIGGDSPRNKLTGGVYTSTEAPPSIKIPLHNELSFVKKFPRYIHFFCQIASPEGGETILGDARKIYHAIDPEIRREMNDKGITYSSCYYGDSQLMELLNRLQRSHKSWKQVFETACPREVERKCRENDFAFRWQQQGWLNIQQKRPAVLNHPTTGEPIWFNQVHLYDFNPRLLGWWRYCGAKIFYCRKHMRLHEVFFGDGSPIPRRTIYNIMQVLDDNTVSFSWQKGDMLLLDNILTMHGRSPFSGKRRVLTAMTG
jgi:alpha-ketoglutarate-dependent taurine dioxygenase